MVYDLSLPHVLAYYGDFPNSCGLVLEQLEQDPSLILPKEDGLSLLLSACLGDRGGNPELVRRLLLAGACPNARVAVRFRGGIPRDLYRQDSSQNVP